MTTCLPLGDPSLSLTMRLSPSLTFVQMTCISFQMDLGIPSRNRDDVEAQQQREHRDIIEVPEPRKGQV